MTQADQPMMSGWAVALCAADILAVDPFAVGGLALRARPGPVRDAWLSYFAGLLPPAAPARKVPLHVTDDRLLGGLDLAATLKAGRPLAAKGLLTEADGGVVILQAAERIEAAAAARIVQALDAGMVTAARDGIVLEAPARFGVVALDEGLDDERPPPALLERLAFLMDLDAVAPRDIALPDVAAAAANVAAARLCLARVSASDDILAALCATAMAFGIHSLRAPLLAVRVARTLAALDGRDTINDDDASIAAQLVLAPRATQMPQTEEQSEPDQPDPPPPEDAPDNEPQSEPEPDAPLNDQPLDDRILEAVKAAIPAGLLAALQAAAQMDRVHRAAGRSGAQQRSGRKGRPAGVRPGALTATARLDVVATLTAAAPWQPLRKREGASEKGSAPRTRRRIEVRKDDFRIARFRQHSETATIFVVDASGSSALHRMAEAKGAVELLLADCYVRRDHVAVIAFRGKSADVLLPPTRSLARAKRSLAGLPGGGGTPLASAIEAATALADAARRKGQTPSVIVLTDGRANIARDGTAGRPKAEADALVSARRFAATGTCGMVIDTAQHPALQARRLADAMSVVYLPLPHADAATLSKAVKATIDDGSTRPAKRAS
jgi:magnesium chelatase subunit D